MAVFFEALQTEDLTIGETSGLKRLHSDRAEELLLLTLPDFLPITSQFITPSLLATTLRPIGRAIGWTH